jgi:glutamine amidotransferase of anthranilate synthase or aminodeoxychorismate synthase
VRSVKILLLDNYDSFVYNLYQALGTLGAQVDVKRNDAVLEQELGEYDGFVISPGPGDPRDEKRTGIGKLVILKMGTEKPVLGVCLGHQEIVHFYGGVIRRARVLKHGKRSLVERYDSQIFEGLPKRFFVGRYHSLVGDAETLPKDLRLTALSLDDRELMGVEHERYPVFGVQFHPESVLTKLGQNILENFVFVCKR